MGNSLPIVVDRPTDDPRLGYEKYVEAIVEAIRGGSRNASRFTIGLFGPWGSGKSSILQAIKRELESEASSGNDADLGVVYFDAWRYEKTNGVSLALLTEMWRTVAQLRSNASAAGYQAWSEIGAAVKGLIAGTSIEMGNPIGKITWSGKEYQRPDEVVPRSGLSRNPEELSLFNSYDMLQEELSKHNKRLVVLVDDLDRCLPENVMNVLESVNTFMDVEGIVFVMALDRDYLIQAIEHYYSSDGNSRVNAAKFLEKIIQIPFSIPTADFGTEAELEDLLPEQWKNIKEVEHLEGDSIKVITDIIKGALRSNPRQAKRFINSFMLISHMNQQYLNKQGNKAQTISSLLYLLGLQLAWPTVYERLVRELNELPEASRTSKEMIISLDIFNTFVLSGEDDDRTIEDEDSESLAKQFMISTNEIEGLRKYVRKLANIPVDAARNLVRFSQDVTVGASSSNNNGDSGSGYCQLQYDNAPNDLRDLYDTVRRRIDDMVEGWKSDVERVQRDRYYGYFIKGGRSFCSIEALRIRVKKLYLMLPLNPDAFKEANPKDWSDSRFEDMSEKGHWGNGDLRMILRPEDMKDGQLKEDIAMLLQETVKKAYTEVGGTLG